MIYARTPEREAKFRRMYLSGVLYKVMANELGLPLQVMQNWRVRLGLPIRKHGNGKGLLRPRFISVSFRQDEYEAVTARARLLNTTTTAYLRNLAKLDLGL